MENVKKPPERKIKFSPDTPVKGKPLTAEEHLAFAKQLYALQDTLRDFLIRYQKGHRGAKQALRVGNELDKLRLLMDSAYCAQFPENPRPADPAFMDSPYIGLRL